MHYPVFLVSGEAPSQGVRPFAVVLGGPENLKKMHRLRIITSQPVHFFKFFWHPFCDPNISKLVVFTAFLRRAQCDRRGPVGQVVKPRPRVWPFAVVFFNL